MKFAIFFSFALVIAGNVSALRGSESALDCLAAVDTLVAGIEVHPSQAVVLFQDALQTNPGCRSQLLMTAIERTAGDSVTLTRLIFAARIEFPEDDNLFAEAAMTAAPDYGAEIRDAFMKSPAEMAEALVIGSDKSMAASEALLVQTAMDEEIREAIARMSAKAEGKYWPEQKLSDEPLHFRKPDEIRVSRNASLADETSLANGLLLDKVDEREIAPFPVRIDDAWTPSPAVRLDESKFTSGIQSAFTEPLEAEVRSIAPAGEAPVVANPVLKKSVVYSTGIGAKTYQSTIDLEIGEVIQPRLVIPAPNESPVSPE